MPGPRVVVIDNHDSFTFNLVQLVARLTGVWPEVFTHDVGFAELDLDRASHVIISPGPGRPDRPADMGVSREVIERATVPVLGVCLGHQGIAVAAGGRVDSLPRPVHGYRSRLVHRGEGLFRGVAPEAWVVRYHSLGIAEPLPGDLRVTARADDGAVMAIASRSRALFGLQFHPESVLSDGGDRILANFLGVGIPSAVAGAPKSAPSSPGRRAERTVAVETLDDPPSPAAIHHALCGGAERSFWLDSAADDGGQARFSYFGCATSTLEADVAGARGALRDIVQTLGDTRPRGADDLPCEFCGGYVGVLAYELGAAFGFAAADPGEPVLQLLRVERFACLDHQTGRLHLVADASAEGHRWLGEARAALTQACEPSPGSPIVVRSARPRRPWIRYLRDIDACLEALAQGESYELCLTNHLDVDAAEAIDPVDLHAAVRRTNPAPYGALLRLGPVAVVSSSPELFLGVDHGGAVVSKPIKGTRPRHADGRRDRQLAQELHGSAKDRAENLMITDLVRNDLGRVCAAGTVVCAPLMAVETFATVHHLVTTVRGDLQAGRTLADVLAATFPGGSMTGAPKKRSMEILADLERGPRGLYSGALGYLGYGGVARLAMLIRSAVVRGSSLSIGTGGAIVAASDPQAELEEMQLKADAVLAALDLSAARSSSESS